MDANNLDNTKGPSPVATGLIAAVLGLAVGYGLASAMTNDDDNTPAANNVAVKTTDTKAADLRTLLNGLEKEHVQLAAQATKAGFDGNTNFDAAGKALFANGDEISAAVGSVYGADAGAQFDKIWDSHLTFFVDYTVGAKTGDKAKMDLAVSNLGGYVDAISDFLSKANPNLPREGVKQLFTEHVTLLKATVDAHGAGNYPESFAKQRETTVQVGKIADALAGAIVKQKPENF